MQLMNCLVDFPNQPYSTDGLHSLTLQVYNTSLNPSLYPAILALTSSNFFFSHLVPYEEVAALFLPNA